MATVAFQTNPTFQGDAALRSFNVNDVAFQPTDARGFFFGDLGQIALKDWSILPVTVATATHEAFQGTSFGNAGTDHVDFYGTGFAYNQPIVGTTANNLIAGTITDMVGTIGGATVEIHGISIAAADLFPLAQRGDPGVLDDFAGTILRGDDTITGSAKNDLLNGYTGNDVIHGGGGDDTIYGGDGNDTLYGDDGNDTLNGGNGDDILWGGAGTNALDGGAGHNTAETIALRLQSTVTNPSSAGMLTAPGETDTLLNVAVVRFTDGAIHYDSHDAAAQSYRIYEAALGRVSDPVGLSYWTTTLEAGGALRDEAGAFVASPEFTARYGALNNTDFVTQLYHNVLGRDGEAGGQAYWTGQLNGGATRGDVVLGFSESSEYVAANQSAVDAGLWVADPAGLDTVRYYETVFGRIPDAAGLSYWLGVRHAGGTLDDMGAAFVGSSEFTTRYGQLNNHDFVAQLYQNSLGRPGEAGGIAYWQGTLDTGANTRGGVVAGFAYSAEMTAKITPLVHDGITFT